MAHKKTKFNKLWLDHVANPQFTSWLSDVPNNVEKAYCKVCCKTFALSNMGIQAIYSHARGPIHNKMLKMKSAQKSASNFFTVKQKEGSNTSVTAVNQKEGTNTSTTSKCDETPATLDSFVLKDDVSKAECLWALQVAANNISFNSCANIGNLFQTMFSDSSIAKQFQLGSTKVAYNICYGLAPYFRSLLLDQVKMCKNYVICFDEALNKIVQKGQMDQVVRFWDVNNQKVSTRYLNSTFLEHATATNLVEKFSLGIAPLSLDNLLQVSMDGPNVNLSFYNKLNEQLEEENNSNKKLLYLGTCGLHVVHGSFKSGLQAADWDIKTLLRHMYFLFKDSPARRANYSKITGSKTFPLKFCSTRWVENVRCLERAIDIFDDVKKFLDEEKSLTTKPATTIRIAIRDPLVKCKMAFFKTIAAECEPFLHRFQSSKPLVPFLYEDLHNMLRNLMSRFLKDKIMKEANTAQKLLDVDLDLMSNLLDKHNVDIGFLARKLLKVSNASDGKIIAFKFECRKMLVAIVKKIKERSPLKYPFVKGLSSLDPFIVLYKAKIGVSRFKIVLECLHTANRISDSIAEKAKTQYDNLCTSASSRFKSKFDEYQENATDLTGLDCFYFELLGLEKDFVYLFEVIKICLIFSHGNASVESGFSVNKALLLENMSESTVVAQRVVYDAVAAAGGVTGVIIDKKMLSFVKSSRSRYMIQLEENRKADDEKKKKQKENEELKKEIKRLENTKNNIKKDALLQEELLQKDIISLKKRQKLL